MTRSNERRKKVGGNKTGRVRGTRWVDEKEEWE